MTSRKLSHTIFLATDNKLFMSSFLINFDMPEEMSAKIGFGEEAIKK